MAIVMVTTRKDLRTFNMIGRNSSFFGITIIMVECTYTVVIISWQWRSKSHYYGQG
jgi:hypothetical protein